MVRLPLHYLKMPPNVTSGMNPLVVMSLVYKFRTTAPCDDDVEPILIDKDYVIIDGKHKYVAAYIAGRYDALVEFR